MSDPIKNQVDSQDNAAFTATTSYEQLVVEIINNTNTRLSELTTKSLDITQNKLFDLSNEADSNIDQTRYFELTNQIRNLKSDIAVDFNINIKKHLVPTSKFKASQNDQALPDDGELSLVDQDDMEGIVLVKGIGERTAAKYSEQLSQLELRFKELALKTDTVFIPEALDPTNFCQAFDDALGHHFNNEDKKVLFAMFETNVVNKLDQLYQTINQHLIDAGILPTIKLAATVVSQPSPVRDHAANHAMENDQKDDGNQEAVNSQDAGTNNINGFAMTAAPGGSYQNTQQNLSPTNNARQTNDVTSGYQHQTAGMPASQVVQALSDFIGAPFSPETANIPAKENAEFFPQSSPQHFGHEEVIQALTNIQNQAQFDQPGDARLNGENIKQAILEVIAKTSGGAVTKRINQIAEKTIDFIELIFDAIVEDKEISDTIKTLLLRLQIPIIKASMADQEFFIYDDHSARILLDTIADVSVGVTEHTDEIYKFLDKTITNILAEYELNTETFQLALDDLNAYIAESNAITIAKEEEEQQQLLRKHARATVLKSLRATTTGKTLPEEVHALILKRWPTLMFNHYLSNGKENDEWTNIVLTLRNIVDSVQAITSAEHLAKLLAEKDALFEQTEKYLHVSSNSKKDVQNVLTAYKDVVQNHIYDANFTEDEVTVAEEVISKAEPVEEAPIEEESQDNQAIPSNIMPGMWFQIYMGEDRAVRRCKLSVILVEDANLMFVNHKGELVAEKSFDEFNAEIADETTKVIMGHSAFENAFKTVINRLN